jgi:hypothetical protein
MKMYRILCLFAVILPCIAASQTPPPSEAAHYYLDGVAALNEGNIETAIFNLETALLLKPDSVPTKDKLIVALRAKVEMLKGEIKEPATENVIGTIADAEIVESISMPEPETIVPTIQNTTIQVEPSLPVDASIWDYYPDDGIDIVRVDPRDFNVVNSDSGIECFIIRAEDGSTTVIPKGLLLAR